MNIHVSNEGESSILKVNWTPGQGDVDSYSVSLSQDEHQLETRPVAKNINEMSFQKLTPGQKYTITIQSISGDLVNNSTASGRTGEAVGWVVAMIVWRDAGSKLEMIMIGGNMIIIGGRSLMLTGRDQYCGWIDG